MCHVVTWVVFARMSLSSFKLFDKVKAVVFEFDFSNKSLATDSVATSNQKATAMSTGNQRSIMSCNVTAKMITFR